MISKEHSDYLKNIKHSKIKLNLVRIAILIIFFILWEIAGDLKWIDPFLTSTPSRMLKSLAEFYNNGTIFRHIWITCYETILGFTLGTIIGTLVAILLWWNKFAEKVFEPYLVVLNALPKIALAPIIIFWVGNGIGAIVVIALLISVVTTTISTLTGFKEIDQDKLKLMQTLGASKFQTLIHLVIPASITTIISALKINVGLSWVGVIMGEFLVAKEGLGFLLVYGGQISQLDMVMMALVILCIIAYLMYIVVAYLENRLKNKY